MQHYILILLFDTVLISIFSRRFERLIHLYKYLESNLGIEVEENFFFSKEIFEVI